MICQAELYPLWFGWTAQMPTRWTRWQSCTQFVLCFKLTTNTAHNRSKKLFAAWPAETKTKPIASQTWRKLCLTRQEIQRHWIQNTYLAVRLWPLSLLTLTSLLLGLSWLRISPVLHVVSVSGDSLNWEQHWASQKWTLCYLYCCTIDNHICNHAGNCH